MTGTGLLETDERLVIAQPELACDDGSIPRNGSPPQAELADFTLRTRHRDRRVRRQLRGRVAAGGLERRTDRAVAGDGSRIGARDVGWDVAPVEARRGACRPGARRRRRPRLHLAARREAGRRRRAMGGGDLRPVHRGGTRLGGVQPLLSMDGWAVDGGSTRRSCSSVVRPARPTLEPAVLGAPPEIRGCAPTIDELTYETVRYQCDPARASGSFRDLGGDRWEMLQPSPDRGSLWELLYPDFLAGGRSSRSSRHPTLKSPLSWRRSSEPGWTVRGRAVSAPRARGVAVRGHEVPLLYATTSGAPYERFEIERVQGPVWPTGWIESRSGCSPRVGPWSSSTSMLSASDGQLGLVYG